MTESASQEATRLAEQIATGNGLDEELDEGALFRALHACAFWASEDGGERRLSAAQRDEWAGRWELIREHIVKQNLGLAYSMIGRFGSGRLNEDDLLSDAMLAMARAVDRFDPWRGYRFSTYACNVISRALIRQGEREYDYRQLFPVQLDASMEPAETGSEPQGQLYVERLQRALEGNLGELTELEARILADRFPRNDGRGLTLREIGRAVGLSKERVRQIQNIALGKLRGLLASDPLLR
jgi:RNA polymerase primary sigma factor